MRYTPIVCLSLSLILWPSQSLPPPEHHTAIAILLPPTKTAKIEREHPTLIIGTTLRSKFPPSPQDDGSVPPAVPERAIPRNIHIPSLPRTQSKNDTVIYVNGVGGQYGGGSGSDFDVGIRRRLHVPLVSSWWKEYYLRKFDGEEELNAGVNLSPPLSYSLLAHIKPSLQSDPYSDCRGIICSVEDVRVPTEDGSFCFSSRISLCPVTSMGIDPGFVSEFDGGGVGSGISGGGNSLQATSTTTPPEFWGGGSFPVSSGDGGYVISGANLGLTSNSRVEGRVGEFVRRRGGRSNRRSVWLDVTKDEAVQLCKDVVGFDKGFGGEIVVIEGGRGGDVERIPAEEEESGDQNVVSSDLEGEGINDIVDDAYRSTFVRLK